MAGNQDLQSHERTYSRMIGFFKVGTVAVGLIALLVIWLISR